MEYWYSILGTHLAKHGDEKRIRTHLNDLLGTPNNLMELDDDEQPAKETILVRICKGEKELKFQFSNCGYLWIFTGRRKA